MLLKRLNASVLYQWSFLKQSTKSGKMLRCIFFFFGPYITAIYFVIFNIYLHVGLLVEYVEFFIGLWFFFLQVLAEAKRIADSRMAARVCISWTSCYCGSCNFSFWTLNMMPLEFSIKT